MSFICVRFVITGGCHNLYSGRQFQLVISLTQDSHRTLVSDVLARVRAEWPDEFSEMKEQARTCSVKMLKKGELLSQSAVFTQYLTQSDLSTAVADISELPSDGEKSPVIVHLVFQQTMAPVDEGHQESPSSRVQRDRTDDRPHQSGGCCVVM